MLERRGRSGRQAGAKAPKFGETSSFAGGSQVSHQKKGSLWMDVRIEEEIEAKKSKTGFGRIGYDEHSS